MKLMDSMHWTYALVVGGKPNGFKHLIRYEFLNLDPVYNVIFIV